MANQDLSKTNTTIGNQSFLSRVSSTLRHSSRINIIIQLLDDTEQITLQLKSNATGQAVLDAACQELNIVEREFFGLRYQDNNRFRFWLDLTKPVNKQLKGNFIFLSLRFRFYPLHPSLLKEDITRYQLFVQLRRDLLHGRLYCTQNDAIQLAGYILQAVLGDYDPSRHPIGYVSEYKLIIKQTERLEEKIADYHQQLRGMNNVVAEREFVNLATSIETYGFDPYVVKDGKQSQDLVVGATCRGILVFSKNQLLKNIPWKYLSKIDYTGKELKIYPTKDFIDYENGGAPLSILDTTTSTMNSNTSISNIRSNSPTKKAQYKFICPSSTFAKHLWRHLLSQQAFFTADEARLVKPKFSRPRIPLFSRGSTFRCPTQKVLHEIEHSALPPREDQPIAFTRYPLPKQLSRSDISAPTSRTGTLKSVRSTKVSPNPKIVEEPISQSSESESISVQNPLKHSESSDTLTTLTSPVLIAAGTSTPIGSKDPQFAFTPPKGSNSPLNTTLESQISSTTSIQTTSDEDLSSYHSSNNHNQYQPTITTKRMEEEKPIEKTLQDNYEEEFPPLPTLTTAAQPLTTTIEQQTNGHASNNGGNAVKIRASRAANKAIKEDTVVKKIIRTVLTIFMFLIIFSSFVIIVFEANDGKGVKWTQEIYPISSFRQIVYDPSKDAVQQIFRRFY
jgi:hypothetical protein